MARGAGEVAAAVVGQKVLIVKDGVDLRQRIRRTEAS